MPASTPTLSDMVKEALDRHTLDQLTARAIDPETGETASRGLIYDLSRNAVNRMPTVEHRRAVAAAIGKPYEVVRRAAIAQWAPPESGEIDTEAILERADRLADEVARLREEIERSRSGGAAESPRETA